MIGKLNSGLARLASDTCYFRALIEKSSGSLPG
jgi:hypothetical protein